MFTSVEEILNKIKSLDNSVYYIKAVADHYSDEYKSVEQTPLEAYGFMSHMDLSLIEVNPEFIHMQHNDGSNVKFKIRIFSKVPHPIDIMRI